MIAATVDRAQMRDAMRRASLAVSKRATLPVLACVRIDAEPGRLTVSANNLETYAAVTIAADVTTPGAALANARDLTAALAGTKDKTVAITSDNATNADAGTVRVGYATLPSLPVDEWPALVALPDDAPRLAEIDADALTAAIARVATAAADDESRPILTGLHIEADITAGTLTLAAADNYRIHSTSVAATLTPPVNEAPKARRKRAETTKPGAYTVPAVTMRALAKILTDGPVTITPNPKAPMILFDQPAPLAASPLAVRVVSRIIDGHYPNYRQVIPASLDPEKTLTVDAAEWRDAMLATAKTDSVGRAIMLADAGRLYTVALGQDGANVAVPLPATLPAGDFPEDWPTHTANGRYMADALAACPTKRARITLDDPLSPYTIRPDDDSDWTSVIMPVRNGDDTSAKAREVLRPELRAARLEREAAAKAEADALKPAEPIAEPAPEPKPEPVKYPCPHCATEYTTEADARDCAAADTIAEPEPVDEPEPVTLTPPDAEPEPIAEHKPHGRPCPVPGCPRTFRKHGSGLSWHLANYHRMPEAIAQ